VKIKDQNYVIKPIFYWLSIPNNPYFPGLFFSNLAIFDFNFLIIYIYYFFMMFLCRLIFQISGSGNMRGYLIHGVCQLLPLKVSIFAWRLLRDRLPTKSNLVIRDIISSESRFCVFGCGQVEFFQHLFLTCNTFGSPWQLMRSLIGFSGADTQVLSDYFSQFINSICGLKARRSFLHLI